MPTCLGRSLGRRYRQRQGRDSYTCSTRRLNSGHSPCLTAHRFSTRPISRTLLENSGWDRVARLSRPGRGVAVSRTVSHEPWVQREKYTRLSFTREGARLRGRNSTHTGYCAAVTRRSCVSRIATSVKQASHCPIRSTPQTPSFSICLPHGKQSPISRHFWKVQCVYVVSVRLIPPPPKKQKD